MYSGSAKSYVCKFFTVISKSYSVYSNESENNDDTSVEPQRVLC